MSSHRCFIALDLPAGIRRATVDVQQALRSAWPDLRFTRPENLHLTLKFLGENSTPDRDRARERLAGLQALPFSMRLASAGVFSPRIAWVALEGADDLQHQVDDALDGLYPPEHRFMGHITIARTRRMSTDLRRYIETLEIPPQEATAETFSFVESHLAPAGPQYETLARFVLEG
jgi:2'-5' RNA ligase